MKHVKIRIKLTCLPYRITQRKKEHVIPFKILICTYRRTQKTRRNFRRHLFFTYNGYFNSKRE